MAPQAGHEMTAESVTRRTSAQDEHAIELRIGLDLRRVDGESVVPRCGQEAAVAFIAHQTLGPARQLALQAGEQRGTGFSVLARLFLIAADDVATALDLDLLHRQIGFALLPRNGQR